MKYSILISILFAIVTTFSAIHEVNHVYTQDTTECLVCVVDHNLVSADTIDSFKYLETLHFDKITPVVFISNFYNKKFTDQNRAPPSLS